MYGKAVSEVKRVATLMKKFSEYCGGDYNGLFEYADENTNINLGTHAIDFREFVELETGYYITDSDWINTGIFTWEKLVEHLNKEVYNTTPWVEDYEGFKVALGVIKEGGVLSSFKVAEKENFSLPYNPVKNISIEKYYRCAKGAPSQCDQFHSENGILFMSESDCGKYYYWEDYNSKNELIFFRGEKSWVEDNYRKVELCKQGITPIMDGVIGEKKVVDLGKVTLISKKEDNSPKVSDKAYRDFGNMVNSLDDTKRITLKGTSEEKKATLLKELISEDEYTGGSVNYYKLLVENPTTLDNAYEVECNDIIEALDMNYAEGNAFKAIWRKCAARKFGVKKKGYDNGLYDSEKVVFFGDRMVVQSKTCKSE